MAGHPARNRSVRCAASQSGRATYEISRRSSPTAITSATSITAKCPFLHSNIMRWHHDNPRRFKISPANGSQPQARLQRRNCESLGCPLLLFPWDYFRKPQRLNPFDNMENYDEEVLVRMRDQTIHILATISAEFCRAMDMLRTVSAGRALHSTGAVMAASIHATNRLQFMLQDNPRR